MVREDILGGLKIALSKGQSLENAMQSFYNAGYKKEEIEDAARALYSSMSQQSYQPMQSKTQESMPEKKQSKDEVNMQPSLVKVPQIPITPVSPPPISQRQLQSQQIVSGYGPPKKRIDFVTILLVIILLLLLGVLGGVFFFKPQIVAFLNKFLA
ncbi:hypothetical protein HY212_07730 [Candidatus Pacearchaeota archaeon]|nr:hypothetical protein [Candidatus Pacearchaeota archaeon]